MKKSSRWGALSGTRLLIAVLVSLMLAGHAWAVVDLNSADEKQLRSVKGIGPVKAKAILAYRARNGGFHSLSELRKIKGFGARTLARISPELTVSARPAATSPAVGPRGRR